MTKRALVIRHAAYGDVIMATCVIPYLIRDGYEVHFLTSNRGKMILENHPRVSKVMVHERDSVPLTELRNYYAELAKDYDKCVVLTGAVEDSLMFSFPHEKYYWPLGKRRRHFNKNYFERHVEMAGYKPEPPVRGEMYFCKEDIIASKNFRHKFKKNLVVLWALSGSSIHKGYLWYEEVARRTLAAIPECIIVSCGADSEIIVTFNHDRVINLPGKGVKFSTIMALTKVVDLVIGPETAVLNAAGCFSTPKICFLTHSSKENLTKYWENDFSMQSECYCSPCHLLHNVKEVWRNVCPPSPYLLNKVGYYAPGCVAEGFPKDKVFNRIMEVYELWKKGDV